MKGSAKFTACQPVSQPRTRPRVRAFCEPPGLKRRHRNGASGLFLASGTHFCHESLHVRRLFDDSLDGSAARPSLALAGTGFAATNRSGVSLLTDVFPIRILQSLVVVATMLAPPSEGQVCRLSVAGLNQSRRVMGNVHAECPEFLGHSAPFGNWGVTSNFGSKGNSHQFDGWCHDTRVCDNAGHCGTDCTDGWYEWNSCTDDALYRPPNCTLFNAENCTGQVTNTSINVHGTKYVDVPVRCPSSSNGNVVLDQGGCNDVKQYSSGTNFMSLYELDPVCCDELVQSIYYPEATIPLACDALGCASAISPWLQPARWDSPATPAKVNAELAVIVNWGAFVDSSGACRVPSASTRAVSGASFTGPNVAGESIVTLFGNQLAPVTAQTSGATLPSTLGGITVDVRDSRGTVRQAGLSYTSPTQVNLVLPAGLALGSATVLIYNGVVVRSTGSLQVEALSPALFTANSDGKGAPAALAMRVSPDGTTVVQPVFQCTGGAGSCVPAPIDLGLPQDQTYLLLFGTGIRNRSSLTSVAVTVGGENARVEYAGAQSEFAGLDQVNAVIPNDLKGRGPVDLVLTVASKPANVVQLVFR